MTKFPRFLPTLAEIEAAKLQIQSEWTEAEERSRRGATPDGQYEIPTSRLRSRSGSVDNDRRPVTKEEIYR